MYITGEQDNKGGSGGLAGFYARYAVYIIVRHVYIIIKGRIPYLTLHALYKYLPYLIHFHRHDRPNRLTLTH